MLTEAERHIDISIDPALDLLKMDSDAQDIERKDTDYFSVALWNEIMGSNYSVNDISDIKKSSTDLISEYDLKFPEGVGMSETDMIRYSTAQSSSSFLGIQNPRKSRFAMKSMTGTLTSHTNACIIHKPWLVENIDNLRLHIKNNPNIMSRDYSDICMTARTSSSSIPNMSSFRDVVLETSYNEMCSDILNGRLKVPYEISAGTRSDRRGKFRLICSFNAYLRVIDYLYNNGSYALCEHNGIFSRYTTEGYNNQMMWPELKKMSNRNGDRTMICIDYKGYDTQISMTDYADISLILNDHRRNDDIYVWYLEWLNQPKCLIQKTSSGKQHIIDHYRTLASGLHGTHSFENIIGISTMLEAQKHGVEFYGFWSNGDDQNAMIRRHDIDRYISFLNNHFDISTEKSLIGHRLTVWGKLWFAENFHPSWEIGTFLSIWQKEKGDTSMVEESKLQSNFSKIVQVAITLIRIGVSEERIRRWINILSHEIGVDCSRIPIKLNNITSTVSSNRISDIPKGLFESKSELMNRTFRFISLNVNNYYDMLLNMYQNKTFYDLNVDEVEYFPKDYIISIRRNVDYSKMIPRDVPYIFRNLYVGKTYSVEDQLVRDILQSTKSYDGSFSMEYKFKDIYTLAVVLNERNRDVWYKHSL
jgi:hypothetical protein